MEDSLLGEIRVTYEIKPFNRFLQNYTRGLVELEQFYKEHDRSTDMVHYHLVNRLTQ